MYSLIDELKSEVNTYKQRIEQLENNVVINETINEIKDDIYDLTDRIDTVEETTLNISVLKSYPVGSVYVSVDSANPATKFGGTWVAFGAGRTLVGVDSTQEEFVSVELTGGEKEHTLTVDEMPTHGHGVGLSYVQSGLNNAWHAGNFAVEKGTWSNTAWAEGTVRGNGGSGRFGTAYNTGGSLPHNNLQPYVTVYMWKRTA